MKNYKVIITTRQIVDVPADSEQQAIERVKAQIQPRDFAAMLESDIQVAEEAIIEELKEAIDEIN